MKFSRFVSSCGHDAVLLERATPRSQLFKTKQAARLWFADPKGEVIGDPGAVPFLLVEQISPLQSMQTK